MGGVNIYADLHKLVYSVYLYVYGKFGCVVSGIGRFLLVDGKINYFVLTEMNVSSFWTDLLGHFILAKMKRNSFHSDRNEESILAKIKWTFYFGQN